MWPNTRETVLLPFVRGKRVLDCGGVDHYAHCQKQAAGSWLHALIAAQAAEAIGVDILQEEVDAINAAGHYHFVCANVEELAFRDEFDVVVGGELIEHLYNPGRFLLCAWHALRPQGTLILTTPNAHSLAQWWSILWRRQEQTHPEHVCLFTPQTLRYLVEHHGFTDVQLHQLDRSARLRLVGAGRSLLIRLFPAICETLMLVARKGSTLSLYGDKW